MSSATLGKNTLEVTSISQHGLWLYWNDREFFLSYENYPWFREAKVKDILNVRLESPEHLYWPDLDVDLSLSILEEPEKYPLVSE
jgi:Protein of unknown function (DUF2442)